MLECSRRLKFEQKFEFNYFSYIKLSLNRYTGCNSCNNLQRYYLTLVSDTQTNAYGQRYEINRQADWQNVFSADRIISTLEEDSEPLYPLVRLSIFLSLDH